MDNIPKLKNYIISRFIIAVAFISVGEYLMIALMNATVMRFLSVRFFNGEDISSVRVGMVLVAIVAFFGSAILRLVEALLPSQMVFTVEGMRAYIEQKVQDLFLKTQSGEIYISLQTKDQILLLIILIGTAVLLLLPYILGAAYFASLIIREFRKIELLEKEKDREAFRKRNLMLSDIAHDLRTPMTTVSGYARALSDDMVSEEKKEEYVDAIIRKSDRMSEMITLLFDYVRTDSEGFALKKESLDICELTRECAANLYQDIEDAGMELSVDIPEKKLMIEADRVNMSRVIQNLLTNAVRHNGPGTRIGVYLMEDNTVLRLMIADDGEEIDEETAEHIFEPFVTGDRSRNSKGGTGLGLSVAHKLISMHGYSLKLITGPYVRKYRLPVEYTKIFLISIG